MVTLSEKIVWLTNGGRHLGLTRTRRKMYLSARIKYYPNTMASLRLTRLTIAGDICPNPGPKRTETSKLNCNICSRTVAINHRVLQCDNCQMFNIKCSGVVVKDFHPIQAEGKQWTCQRCMFTLLPLDTSFQSTNNSFNSDNADVSLSAWETEKDPLQHLINIKLAHNNQPPLYHLNINSLQNKFN